MQAFENNGAPDRIRTYDPSPPRRVRYRAAPRSDTGGLYPSRQYSAMSYVGSGCASLANRVEPGFQIFQFDQCILKAFSGIA